VRVGGRYFYPTWTFIAPHIHHHPEDIGGGDGHGWLALLQFLSDWVAFESEQWKENKSLIQKVKDSQDSIV
jgi:hypothetical protein